MLRVGVLSDTHLGRADDPSELAALARFHFAGVRMILHAGDLVSADRVREALADFELIAVTGNMDDAATCQELPARREVALGGFRIGLVHGWGDPAGVAARVAREFARVDCVVYGHTHIPENETRGGVLFFNPGSPTDRRWASRRSLGILEVSDRIVGRLIALED